MAWGILVLLVGLAYGWWRAPMQDWWNTVKAGFFAGGALAGAATLAGWALGTNPLGLSTLDAPGLLLAVVVLTVLFTLGIFGGEWIRTRMAHRLPRAA